MLVPFWKVEWRWVILIFSSAGGWRGFIFLFDYFWHFCERLSWNSELEVFAPPPPWMACAHGRVERIFGSETAREGNGRRGLSRFSRAHNPFPLQQLSFPFKRLSRAQAAAGSPFKMWFPFVPQNSLTYKQKFRKHVFSAYPLAVLVFRKENVIWKGKFKFFLADSFPLLSALPWVHAIQASLYLFIQAYKLSIPFGPVFRKACVHFLDNGFRKHLFSEQWLI